MAVRRGPAEGAGAAQLTEWAAHCALWTLARMCWARLLKRDLEIDREHCPNCTGAPTIKAAMLEEPVIEKILGHLGLSPHGLCEELQDLRNAAGT